MLKNRKRNFKESNKYFADNFHYGIETYKVIYYEKDENGDYDEYGSNSNEDYILMNFVSNEDDIAYYTPKTIKDILKSFLEIEPYGLDGVEEEFLNIDNWEYNQNTGKDGVITGYFEIDSIGEYLAEYQLKIVKIPDEYEVLSEEEADEMGIK